MTSLANPSMRFTRHLAAAAALATLLGAQGTPPRTGHDVLHAMQDAYAGKWFRTLTFVQKTTTVGQDGKETVTTWYESLRQPENGGTQLRIDTGDPALGNGVLYTADSLHVFRAGKRTVSRAGGNALLPLIEGVYLQPHDRTLADLKATGVDLTLPTLTTTWNGRATWVVGAHAAGDTLSPQFWVDAETKMAVRAIFSPAPGAPAMDMRLEEIRPAGRGLLATKCLFYLKGSLVQTEEYSDWRADRALDPGLFDPTTWSTAPHWARQGGGDR